MRTVNVASLVLYSRLYYDPGIRFLPEISHWVRLTLVFISRILLPCFTYGLLLLYLLHTYLSAQILSLTSSARRPIPRRASGACIQLPSMFIPRPNLNTFVQRKSQA